ncbi:MAG: glycine--tRNA ligase [Deltaproteobacteria bacterium]|nr:glycine--tRNA ligase [Deltaproteobacteria bacterium]
MDLQDIVSFCKRRGFIYPSSEIYGGLPGVYDYGPYGIELKNNVAAAWWKHVVHNNPDVVGIDSGIFMHPMTWKASGHLDNFDDAQMDCKKCKARIRADIMLEKYGVNADKFTVDEINQTVQKLREDKVQIKCPECGSTELTEARRFNLMVKSNLGSPTEAITDENVVYARAETCQGIYLNYKNILNSTRQKVPFGIAQIGKAFRNEIVVKQFIFRTREFEQMEMQYFVHPDDAGKVFERWRQARWDWYVEFGIDPSHMRWYEHQKLAHYASAAFDIEYDFQALGGFREVEGLHMRGDWDLSQHQKFSKEKLEYFDPVRNINFIPNVVETSAGLNRGSLVFMHEALKEEQLPNDSKRTVLKIDPRLAPVKIAVFPLLANKPALIELAEKVFRSLNKKHHCEFDDNGNIGKRYRRQDEIGTPYCVTVDFSSTGEQAENAGTVTIRNRDTMQQDRVGLDQLDQWFADKLPVL